MLKKIMAFVAAASAAFVLVSCGGDGKDTSSTAHGSAPERSREESFSPLPGTSAPELSLPDLSDLPFSETDPDSVYSGTDLPAHVSH